MEKMARIVSFKIPEDGRIDKNQRLIPDSIGDKDQRFFYWLILLGILLFAAFLRLYRIQDYMTFLGDEGRDALVVYGILHGKFTLLGPTASVGGFFLGPIYYYFTTPFLWLFNYNPVGSSVMVALFGTATVFLVYKIGSEFFGRRVGLMSAFLYSIAPLVIAHSRSSWNPNLVPFFSLLTLYLVYKAVNKNKAKLFILSGILLGITMQLHYLATFVGVIIGVYVFFSKCHAELDSASKKIRISKSEIRNNSQNSNFQILKTKFLDFWLLRFVSNFVLRTSKDYLYIFLGFLVGWSPFLAFEVRHGFPNLQSIISFVFASGDTGKVDNFSLTVYDVFFRLFGRLVTNFPPPEQVSLGIHPNIAFWYYATLALAVVSALLLAQRFIVSLNNKEQFQKISLMVLWLVIGIGLFGFYKKSIYDYYFGFMFPLPFILVGITLKVLYSNFHELTRIKLTGKILAIVISVVLVLINLKGMPFLFPPNKQLAQVEKISRFVLDKSEGKPFNFALISRGNSDHAYRYFFTLWDSRPVTIENPQKDPERKTATDQLLVVCETSPCGVLGHSLWEVAGFGRAEIVDEWNVSVVKVFKLKHYEGK